MIATFAGFTLRTARNRIVYRLRRLRDPRYLIGAVAGIAYLWLIFFRNTRHVRPGQTIALTGDLLVDVLSLVVLCLMLGAWALPGDSGGLQFSEAEITFLFSAPIRRRDLLIYKIIRSQPQALASAVMFFIFGWRRSWLVGVWAAISVLSIYFTFVALARARLKLMHVGFVARLLIVTVIVNVLVWVGVANFERHPIKIPAGDPVAAARQVDAAFREARMGAVLFIPRIVATAATPPSPAALAASCGGLALMGAVFFILAARMNVSFEEASIVTSAKRAAMLERMRERRSGRLQVSYRRMGPLFRLGETGAPEVAVVWKNVIALMRTGIGFVVLFLALAALLAGIAIYHHDPDRDRAIGMMFVMLAAFFPLLAPQLFSNDLRLDLARAEILKSYPLSGDRLVAAEIAAPLVVITALEIVYAVLGSVFLGMAHGDRPFDVFVATPQFIVTVLILTLPVCTLLLLIRNAVPLYFPAWTVRGADDARGFVVAGQRMVVLLANLLALAITLIPAAIVFLPSIWIAAKFFSGNAVFMAVATVPAAVVLVGEAWLGVKALGARFDDMDVSNEFDAVSV